MDSNPYSFLAVVDRATGSREVAHVSLEAKAQEALTLEFLEQAKSFRSAQEVVAYEPSYAPSGDELVVLDPFSLPPDLATALANVDALSAVTEDDLTSGRLKALFAARKVKGAWNLLFQRVQDGQVIRRSRRYLFLSGETFDQADRSGLTVASTLTAIYDAGRLYFRSEEMVRRFLDLDAVFHDATDKEVEAFCQDKLWCGADEAAVMALADRWTRRRIATIQRSGVLASVPVQTIASQSKHYDLTLKIDGKGPKARIVMPTTKKEFKILLQVLDQDLFASILTNDRYVTNSKRAFR